MTVVAVVRTYKVDITRLLLAATKPTTDYERNLCVRSQSSGLVCNGLISLRDDFGNLLYFFTCYCAQEIVIKLESYLDASRPGIPSYGLATVDF